MTVNEATVLARRRTRSTSSPAWSTNLSARVTRLENAVCIVVSDETLPMDTRMDVASALMPTLEQAA
jgi:hypothetical protein